jgi:hypothetical protein
MSGNSVTVLLSGLSLLLSGASFFLCGFALWIAQFNRGKLKMIQPTLICLKRDPPDGKPKIFLRTLLFTTGVKGRVIQSMFLRVHNRLGAYLFDFWGHTEGGKLTLGSGLFVGPTGIACDHHFNPPRNSKFQYVDGAYRIEILAVLVGQPKPRKLIEVTFSLDDWNAGQLLQIENISLWLVWNADERGYDQNIEQPPAVPARQHG